jgi:diguanylate cyclase (GGDEF)-like protein
MAVTPVSDAEQAQPGPDELLEIVALRTTSAGLGRGHAIERLIDALRGDTDAEAAAVSVGPPAGAGALERRLAGACGLGAGPASYAEEPVVVDGRPIGRVGILDRGPREWTAVDRRSLERAADALAIALELREARIGELRVRDLVASHNRVHDLIAHGAPLTDVLDEIARSIELHDPSLIVSVLLLDRESNTLHPGAGPSLPGYYLEAVDGVVIGPNVGSCGSAAWSGELTRADDIATDPKWTPIRELALGAGLRHCWSMPIQAPSGDVVGTLAFYGASARAPLPEHLTLLHDWSRVAGIAIERHQTLERLRHDARHDGLTRLPNRTAIFETLEAAIGRAGDDGQVAILFLDLDGLKTLNDTLGHDRADEMIREVGVRLGGAVRAGDFVGRFGGDEFVVIAEQVSGREEASQLGLRLLEVVSEPLPGIDQTVVTASVGIMLVQGTTIDAREAIRQADSAMYAAKRAGRDRCVFVEGKQRVRTGRRLLLARDLRGAEMRGEMRIVFQPVVALAASGGHGTWTAGPEPADATDRIVGVEALLRWDSPRFGEVSPGEFIPIAEDTGSIISIGAWVLRESCEAIAALTQASGRSLELSVNASTLQLSNPDFATWVKQTLAHAQFPAARLTLEVTETALMRPDATTLQTLRALDEAGVEIALDDFGTGFSSLSWLKEHPLGAIKIDRGFVSGLPADRRDRAIVSAIVEMAGALGCTVTAEGIETPGQLESLRTMGCERVQGFLLARPIGLDQLTELIARQPAP